MIKTLIVMTTYGQIFFSKEDFFDQKPGESDISLTAGLISAIYNMTSETQQQRITELELEDLRSVFRELPGEKLFIITVDKRMDTSDADDMLDDLSTRFKQKYGDMVMDGMVLNDFEPVVDEVVEDRLWYNSTVRNPQPADILPFALLMGLMIWYPFMLIRGQSQIIDPLQMGLQNGIINFLLQSVIIGAKLIIPLFLTLFSLKYYPNLGKLFKYTWEFFQRPTRGGYAEMLPWWFLALPLLSMVLTGSFIYFARGIQYALSIQVFPPFLDRSVTLADGTPVFWNYVTVYLIFYFMTWFLAFPTILGVIIGNTSRNWYKAVWIIVSMSLIAFVPAHFIGGYLYHVWWGYDPASQSLFGEQSGTLAYFFTVSLPSNFFTFLLFFLNGIGIAQLVKKNRERFPIAFAISLFITIALQDIIFFLMFKWGQYGLSEVFG